MTEKAKKKRKDIVISVFNHTPSIDYEHATIKELCEISGISIGAFYHYFGDKAGFFSQVFAIVDDYILQKVSNEIIGNDHRQDLMKFCIGFSRCAEEMGAKMFKSVYASCPYFSDEDERKRPLFTIPYHIIDTAQKKNEIRNDQSADELSKQLLVILRGYVYDWSHRDGNYNLMEQVKKVADTFIRGIQK